MSDYGDNIKYKWTPESTSLLVSVWTDKQVQKQLEYAQRPQLIWESVARYMRKKGYGVSAKQCRSRMKQVLVCYREAKRAGSQQGAGVEQYYESIDKVLKNKRADLNDVNNGVDTVDSAAIIKSPPKDVKTNKNLRMRYNKYNEPMETLIRTEALSPTWHLAHEEEYPDSPESNETVLAQPYRTFSPTRDAATNTLNGRSQILTKGSRRSLQPIDQQQPMRETRPIETMPNNRFGEMLYQNAVQNVQNQIIQENMQQRNLLQNQFIRDEGMGLMEPEQLHRRHSTRNPFYTIDDVLPVTKLRAGAQRIDDVVRSNNPPLMENAMRMQNQLQSAACPTDNRAMPQEARRRNFAQNLAINYKLYKDAAAAAPPNSGGFIDDNLVETRQRATTNYSPETVANLNEAFCHLAHKDERNHNLNENYEQPIDNNDVLRAMNATTITNNATFNDDTLSIEFLEGSPSPSDNGAAGSKSISGNSDRVPDAPVRKKKVQKLEQLMLSAITSQNEVVNKILAAQDAMVSRFLDLDRDRQNRLENRLDHLMNVVHATVINKSPDKDSKTEIPPGSFEPVITSLAPPPRPGVVPPKLDLVPPKPCRVACTSVNANVELVNKNSIQTRPGVVSPGRPVKQPGAIWSKLGPVSQSPFVKAQQHLGLRGTMMNWDARTQSSAERKITREMANLAMDRRAILFETEKFIDIERHMEEQMENAKILTKMGQEVAARRKLFESRGEPNAGMILTAAFLDAERHAASINNAPSGHGRTPTSQTASGTDDDEELMNLASQVDNYERLRRFNVQSRMPNEPCDTSTPAKGPTGVSESRNFVKNELETNEVPKQTIQQLAELVMKSARWREAATNPKGNNHFVPSSNAPVSGKGFNIPEKKHQLNVATDTGNNDHYDDDDDEIVKRAKMLHDEPPKSHLGEMAERESRNKTLVWLQNRYSYGGDDQPIDNHIGASAPYEGPIIPPVPLKKSYPIGFTMDNLFRNSNENPQLPLFANRMDLKSEIAMANANKRRNVAFADMEGGQHALVEKNGQAPYPRQRRQAPEPPQQQHHHHHHHHGINRGQYSTLPLMHRNMIDRYVENDRGIIARRQEQDSDDEDEFLDTTTSMQPQSRKTSLTSNGTLPGKAGNCVIS